MDRHQSELIFESNRLVVRKLKRTDLEVFHKMQSDAEVMKYVQLTLPNREENEADLKQLIERYTAKANDFWIYAVCKKEDQTFIGTVALVKSDENEDEIGYRFLPAYWGKGFGTELVGSLIAYCKKMNYQRLIACVAEVNLASARIIEHYNFLYEKSFMSDLALKEKKYSLQL